MRSIDFLVAEIDKHKRAETISNFSGEMTTLILDEVQNIVVQAAAVSRFFWPVWKGYEARAETLKSMYGMTENSPLRLSKNLRDAIEHFDERLDKYLASWPVGRFIPEYVGPQGDREGVPLHFFRAYFLDVGVFEILSVSYSIQPIVNEIVRINQIHRQHLAGRSTT